MYTQDISCRGLHMYPTHQLSWTACIPNTSAVVKCCGTANYVFSFNINYGLLESCGNQIKTTWFSIQKNKTTWSPPVAWGDQNSANVCPFACRKRRLIIGYKLSYIYHRLTVCLVFLHAVRRMSLDSLALGCPGSGNILFQMRMSSFF